MTPHDFLRSITPGIQQPANKGLDQFTNITKNDINSLAKDFKVDQSSIFNHLGSGISIFMIIKYENQNYFTWEGSNYYQSANRNMIIFVNFVKH